MQAQLSPDKILQTGLAFWASKTLLSAIELGVFTQLAGAPTGLDALRQQLGLHPRAARDFLDALVALGFLTRTDGRYANAPDTELFLDAAKPSYVGGILEMANQRLYPFWASLTEALRTGLPQNEARAGGASLFDTIYAEPARLKQFLAAMTGISRGANLAIARAFSVERLRHVRRRGDRTGRPRRADRAGQPAPARHRHGPAGGAAGV